MYTLLTFDRNGHIVLDIDVKHLDTAVVTAKDMVTRPNVQTAIIYDETMRRVKTITEEPR